MGSRTVRGRAPVAGRALSFGPDASIALESHDPAVIPWIEEYFGPALTPDGPASAPRLGVTSSTRAHAELRALRPAGAAARPWFAFDQSMLSLPTWDAGEATLLADDEERGCVLSLSPGGTELVGDPDRRRWRFTLVLAIHELIATPLRGRQLETHAAAVEFEGRTILIVGPKRAGKTTLSFNLLRSGLCSSIANDRAFAGEEGGEIVIRGVPTSLRVPPPMAARFPELAAGLPEIDRPHVYSAEELADPPASAGAPLDSGELLLSMAQAAERLGAPRRAAAPLGAVVFPEVDLDASGWSVERLSPEEAGAGIWANLFGSVTQPRPATVFEEREGGAGEPPRSLAARISEAVPAHRAVLGPGAYDDPDFAKRFLAAVERRT